MKIRDPKERTEIVTDGQFIIIPAGIEHCPMADEECEIVLMEPRGTLNTGNAQGDDRQRDELPSLY